MKGPTNGNASAIRRFLGAQALGGGAIGLATLDLLMLVDCGGLYTLLGNADDGWVAMTMLAVTFTGIFAAAAVATAPDMELRDG